MTLDVYTRSLWFSSKAKNYWNLENSVTDMYIYNKGDSKKFVHLSRLLSPWLIRHKRHDHNGYEN